MYADVVARKTIITITS